LKSVATLVFSVSALSLALLGTVGAAERERRDDPPERFADYRLGLAHVGEAALQQDVVFVRWLGTGFLVDGDCTVVTAKHIVPPSDERLIVRFQHPDEPDAARTFDARVLRLDPDRDLAYLSFGGGQFGRQFCRSRSFRPFRLAESFEPRALAGRDVWILGYPVLEGEQPREVPLVRHGSVSSGELEWNDAPMILLDLAGVPGLSGAPVVRTDDGTVIGVVYGPGRTDRRYDLEWATPITDAMRKSILAVPSGD